jgi:hypothetical protein
VLSRTVSWWKFERPPIYANRFSVLEIERNLAVVTLLHRLVGDWAFSVHLAIEFFGILIA